MTRAQRAVILIAAVCSVAWLNPERDQVAAGNQAYDTGKYDEAITAYGQALVDDPDSSLLHFNMGTASYKAGKYPEAMASFGRVGPGDASANRAARTAYNTGNVYYRLGAAAEAEKPQDALTAYANALVAYRRAIGLDPADKDAKFNYEFVTQRIEDLKKKLEEQQKQKDKQQQKDQQQKDQQQKDQEQAQQDQQKDQQQNDQQDKDQQQQDKDQQQKDQQGEQQQEQQQQADKSAEEKEQEQKQAAEDQAKKDGEEQQAQAEPTDQQGEKGQQAGATDGEPQEGMSPQEAAALIDTARGDEVQPDEFIRHQQGAGVAEPAQDW